MFPPMFVAELSLFLLIKTCSVDGKSFLDDKKLVSIFVDDEFACSSWFLDDKKN